MTVADLMDFLSKMDPDTIVVLPVDKEEILYSPLCEINGQNYLEVVDYRGVLVDEEKGGVPCVALGHI